MSDGYLEFSEDDTSTGYRLDRIELLNWGTFNSRVWTLPLNGKNGLLTGDIGSGKSTLVDAVTTLLVPAHRVSYNKAAGAEFKERSLRSYVLGYYKSERGDGGYSAKPVPLRKEGESHSVIMGVFHNVGYNQTVTLAQVFLQKNAAGQPDRFYVISDGNMSIREDFANFGSEFGQLKKKLKSREKTEVFDTFPAYGARFRSWFGLKNEQALELFHQTVSMKTVGNLTAFVREHMLEAFDGGSRVEGLINHFEDLNKSHEAVLRAKKQISLLSPLIKNLDLYNETDQQVTYLTQCRESLSLYFSGLKRDLLSTKISQEEDKAAKLELKRNLIKGKLVELQSNCDGINKSIAENGGNRLDSLKKEKNRLVKDKELRIGKAGEYDTLAAALEIPLLNSSDDFVGNKTLVNEQQNSTVEQRSDLNEAMDKLKLEFSSLMKSHDMLDRDIISLKSRRSNIDFNQIKIRDQLCRDLNLREKDLPFAGELISLKEEEQEWEGAVERVLHNFGLSLLVPEALYPEISQWVDRTRLRGRLVYYRVGDFRKSPLKNPDTSLLTGKLDLKKESPFHDWLKEQLDKRFDYNCCENLKEFRLSRKALTHSGQIKGSQRHEKDDRHDLNDRSRYILGWTNEAKLSALQYSLEEKKEELRRCGEKISQKQSSFSDLDKRKDLLSRIQVYSHYEEMNWKPLAESIDKIGKEIDLLEGQSNLLKTLQNSLALVEKDIAEENERLEKVITDLAKANSRLEQHREQDKIEEELLKESGRCLEEINALMESVVSDYLEGETVELRSCSIKEKGVRGSLQVQIDSSSRRQKATMQKIISAMQDFRGDYPAETKEIDASLEAGHEYRLLLDRLNGDNLPKFESKFKKQLNENTINEIGQFQAQLRRESHEITERVNRINKSMHEIEYNRDRYIRLEDQSSNDPEIRDFRLNLKACIEDTVSGIKDDQYTETKFLQVKEIISRFKGREGYSESDRKWTAKVTDVRNWFSFAASERWLADDTEYEHYTDSGGKSGGQKEKLAYTVLAASLAYQFGLEWNEVHSRSFRFVVIDEAFGRGSDESARYGLELFRKLNLQLLIVTPLQKIHIIEPYVSTVGFVHNEEGMNSLLRCLTIKQYRKEKEDHEK